MIRKTKSFYQRAAARALRQSELEIGPIICLDDYANNSDYIRKKNKNKRLYGVVGNNKCYSWDSYRSALSERSAIVFKTAVKKIIDDQSAELLIDTCCKKNKSSRDKMRYFLARWHNKNQEQTTCGKN